MVTGVIEYKKGTLIVTLPCALYDLSAHLGSIGLRTPASRISAGMAVGMKGLAEEARRYRLAMENYTRACKAAEDEEYEMPENEEWER